jgi:glycosyltransferase involved in cell wall biosynthesis
MPISIIIPVLNGERYVGDAIRSALGQDCERPIEVIVVDDGSSDGTAAVASRFRGVTVISTPQRWPICGAECRDRPRDRRLSRLP